MHLLNSLNIPNKLVYTHNILNTIDKPENYFLNKKIGNDKYYLLLF